MGTKKINEVETSEGTILVLFPNVHGSDLQKKQDEGKSEAEILALRLAKAKALRAKQMEEEAEEQRKADLRVAQLREERRQKQLARDLENESELLALLEAEEAKEATIKAEAEAKAEKVKTFQDSITSITESLTKMDYFSIILPLLNQLETVKTDLDTLVNPPMAVTAKSKKSDLSKDTSFKEDSAFYLIQKVITESGANGISKKDLFAKVFDLKVNKSVNTESSINWSISQLAKKTSYQFDVINGVYFAK